MTAPADNENFSGGRQTGVPFEELSTDDKLVCIWEHVNYLSQTVSGLLGAMQAHPMGRMMLGRISK